MANIYFITGGERSGKSSYAQQLALQLSPSPVYIATARFWDEDFRKRIQRHQEERDSRWISLEEEKHLNKLDIDGKVVVIDCVTLWLSNFYCDTKYNVRESLNLAQEEFKKVANRDCTLIIISNEIGMGVHAETEISRKFVELQGWMNQYIAAKAENIVLMISGIPMKIAPISHHFMSTPDTAFKKPTFLQQLTYKQKSAKPENMNTHHLNNNRISIENISNSNNYNSDKSLRQELQSIIDNKTKPHGSLGTLEKLALQIGEIFSSRHPKINNPHIVVFAADHGIAQHGVSAYPQEVTWQMVQNFLSGGAAINVFSRLHNIALTIVDAGVDYDFPTNTSLVNSKIEKGTRAFVNGPAMNLNQVHECLLKGEQVVNEIFKGGCNTIGFGEMGIGNTSSASVLMSLLCNIPIEECIGAGTGIKHKKLSQKKTILKKAINNYKGNLDLFNILKQFGGFEIIQMAGAMSAAYKNNMLIMVDGFISTVAFLIAFKLDPSIKKNTIFCHCSAERGHRLLLDYLKAKEILQLYMRLGEGTGCAVAFPIIKSAVAFLNEMASFESAGISNRENI